MTLQEFTAQAISTLGPLVLLALSVLTAWLTKAAREHIQDKRLATTLETITKLVATAVADAFQTVVKDLKDPTKPGEWNATTAASIKWNVIEGVKNTAPAVLEQLQQLGVVKLDELLAQLVEQRVVALNAARLPPAPTTPITQLSMAMITQPDELL